MHDLQGQVDEMGVRVTALAHDVGRLNTAVWGDRDRIREVPGVISELRSLEDQQKETNEILRDMRTGQRQLFWMTMLAIVGAALKVVFGGGL